ncbi:hypothetical protein K8S17_00850, partial [bacterium]|nr:hypothetical protein [bacterium]
EGALLSGYVPHSDVDFWWSGGGGAVDIDAQILNSGSISGEGVVAVLEFKGIYEGVSPITLSSVTLSRSTGAVIAPCVTDGTVTVYGGSPVEQTHWGVIKSLYR